jgi:hypothetical protein
MSEEQVLFDDRTANITVTNERFIIGDDVIGIDSLSHARCANSDGFKDYAIAVLLGVVGIALVFTFSWWSILGLVLLINPFLVFSEKKKWWVFVFTRGGDAIAERGNTKRKYTKDTAQEMTQAINAAIEAYRKANDPRSNLNL